MFLKAAQVLHMLEIDLIDVACNFFAIVSLRSTVLACARLRSRVDSREDDIIYKSPQLLVAISSCVVEHVG